MSIILCIAGVAQLVRASPCHGEGHRFESGHPRRVIKINVISRIRLRLPIMDTLAKSEIFFFITSIAVVLFTIVGVVIAFYLIKISRNISEITERAKDQAGKISNDIDALRENIKEEGVQALKKFKFIANLFGSKKTKNK